MKRKSLLKQMTKTFVVATMALACIPLSNAYAATAEVKGDYEKAVGEIVIPRYEDDGKKVDQKVSDTLKSHLNRKNITATKDDVAQTLTVDVQLKDVRLTSDYLNGKTEAGISYYNMLNFYTDVKQVKQLLDDNAGYSVIDSKGNNVDAAYVEELLGLLDQINDMDPETNIQYDMKSVFDTKEFASDTSRGGTDVIATSKDGNVSFEFHIDSHGYWGYDLGAHDSITGVVMGYAADFAQENQRDLTTKYANFFAITMPNITTAKGYMLNATDLENPMIYVSKDGKEALMIDVDMYGENVINQVIKSVIGPDCESLKIFCTHMHGDHVNNLAKIYEDEDLRDIITVIWPENEPHTKLGDKDLVTLFGEPQYIKDMEKITVAGTQFQFIEIPEEHTKAGGQLVDLDNKINYCGDTLGAQVHLGGTNVTMSTIDNWIAGCEKTIKHTQDNGIKYFIGGHTPYLNTPDFAKWVKVACEYAKEQYAKDNAWKGGLVIVENGAVVTGERMGQMFANGLSDREELLVASVNFRNDLAPKPPVDEDKKPPVEGDKEPPVIDGEKEPTTPPTQTPADKTPETSDATSTVMVTMMTMASLVAAGYIYLNKKEC